ncbi:RNA exonuclease 4 [Hyperolius riggenbachi]|uniref:RNA exonuclease 4 n=1 Tax=Hyperolius riggenbachi TaxID=752182 RepID=UPI0035A2EDAF
MGKMSVKTDKPPSGVKKKKQLKQTKKQKKKKFWKNHPKIATNPAENKVSLLLAPPNKPEEFSSNWRALQALLKSEKSVSVANSVPTNPPKKVERRKDPESKKTSPGDGCSAKGDAATDRKTGKVTAGSEAADRRPEKRKRPGETGEAGTADRRPEKRKRPGETVEARTADRRPDTRQRDGENALSKKKQSENKTSEPPKIDLWFDDVDPDDIESALGPEAGQMARKMQGLPEKKVDTVDKVLVKDRAFEGLTRTVAMDCEMVGVGLDGEDSIVARVSIVNQFGKCVYDKFVKPTERVTDYRTAVSGVRPQDIKNGEDFKVVQKEVSEILKGRILVGHAVHNDLKILFLDHPKKAIRDTQKYKPFRREAKSGRPSLKLLCKKILHVKVQTGEHNSIQDAQAAMRLYTMEKKNWEIAIKEKYNKAKPAPQKDKAAPQ